MRAMPGIAVSFTTSWDAIRAAYVLADILDSQRAANITTLLTSTHNKIHPGQHRTLPTSVIYECILQARPKEFTAR